MTGVKRAMGTWLEVSARRKNGNVVPVSFVVTENNDKVEALLATPADDSPPDV